MEELSFDQLIINVHDWANDKGLIDPSFVTEGEFNPLHLLDWIVWVVWDGHRAALAIWFI